MSQSACDCVATWKVPEKYEDIVLSYKNLNRVNDRCWQLAFNGYVVVIAAEIVHDPDIPTWSAMPVKMKYTAHIKVNVEFGDEDEWDKFVFETAWGMYGEETAFSHDLFILNGQMKAQASAEARRRLFNKAANKAALLRNMFADSVRELYTKKQHEVTKRAFLELQK